jgi:GNAT superfamily N-acetyltransferase
MSLTKIFDPSNKPSQEEKDAVVDFLFEHLDQFGDPREQILNAVNYSLKEIESFGGFVLVAYEDEKIICAVVVNRTGMNGYIPDNILVYIATHVSCRGKGVGKEMMYKAMETAEGNVALHVEADNPAKFLYEKVGFTNPYLEMRYIKK